MQGTNLLPQISYFYDLAEHLTEVEIEKEVRIKGSNLGMGIEFANFFQITFSPDRDMPKGVDIAISLIDIAAGYSKHKKFLVVIHINSLAFSNLTGAVIEVGTHFSTEKDHHEVNEFTQEAVNVLQRKPSLFPQEHFAKNDTSKTPYPNIFQKLVLYIMTK